MDAKKASLTRDEVVKSFSICDNTQSGFIAIKRLKIVMRAMGFEPRQSEIDQLILKMQANKLARQRSSDSFSLEELLEVLEDKLASNDTGNEVQSAFDLFDVDKKGHINIDDLKRVANELGEKDLEDKDFEDMLQYGESNEKGKVNFNDFKMLMEKTKLY